MRALQRGEIVGGKDRKSRYAVIDRKRATGGGRERQKSHYII